LRYELVTTPTEADGKISNLRRVTDPELTVGGPWHGNPSLRNFAPRLGLAWDPFGTGKTSVRAGFGLFYDEILPKYYFFSGSLNPPFTTRTTIINPPFPNVLANFNANAPIRAQLQTVDYDLQTPYIMQFNLSVQRSLPGDFDVTVAYVGSRGWNVMRPLSINDPPPGLAAARGVQFNAVRPSLGYGAITVRQDTASSVYHSLQVSLNRRFSGRYSLGASYTFQKSIDNASSERNGSDVPPDARNPNGERAPSDFDRTQVLTSNFIWNLPNLVRARSAGALFNGWEFSGILRFYTGNPFDVQLSTDVAGIGAVKTSVPT